MLTRRLEARALVQQMEEALQKRQAVLKQQGVEVNLGVLRVGQRADDLAYFKRIQRLCERFSIRLHEFVLPSEARTEDVLECVEALSKQGERGLHGLLLFRPFPSAIDEAMVRSKFPSRLDVEGFTELAMAKLYMGEQTALPCTAEAARRLLKFHVPDLKGKTALIIGRSLVVGKPLAHLLLQEQMTVTVAHRQSQNLPSLVRATEVIVLASGTRDVIQSSDLHEGQIVVDVGIHVTEDGKLRGDLNPEGLEAAPFAYTPVPGGVGSVTSLVLIEQVIQAAEQAQQA